METTKQKYIKQVKLAGSKSYFPNRYYTPYDFMDKFNEAIQKKFDIKVIEVKYVISIFSIIFRQKQQHETYR